MSLRIAKLFIGVVITFLSFSPIQVFAEGCKCTVYLDGTGCDLDQSEVFAFGQNFSVNTLLDKVSWFDCPAKSIASQFVDGKETISVTKASCENMQENELTGTEGGFTYKVNCAVSNDTPTVVGTPIVTSTPPAGSSASNVNKNNKGDSITLINPIGSTKDNPQGQTDITVLVGRAIKQALGIIGAISFGVFVVGGFMWLTSAGNSDQIKKGTETMVWAGIGVCIIFASYAILGFVITGIGAGNAGPSAPLRGDPNSSGAKPPGGTTAPAAGSLCDQYFAKDNLGCFKETACDASGVLHVEGGAKKTFADNFDAIRKQTKNIPELKGTHISNLCPGTAVCCIKKVVPTGPLCDQYFAGAGLSCNVQAECDTDGTAFASGGSIAGILTTNSGALQEATNNDPKLESNYVSNLCGTGNKVCCKKKVVVKKKCVFKADLKANCAARQSTSGFACASPDPKVCELVSGACVPKKVPSECMVLTTESECAGMSDYCEWK